VVRGDVIVGNATPSWTRLAVGASNTFLRSNGTDVSWASPATVFATLTVRTSLTCGVATIYAAPMYHACNATEATVDYALPAALTVSGIACIQVTDSSCTTRFTLRQNTATVGGGAPTFQCTDTNRSGCSDTTGSAAYAANDTIDVLVEDTGATCTDAACEVFCTISYTIP
jgi:hypothetical protein